MASSPSSSSQPLHHFLLHSDLLASRAELKQIQSFAPKSRPPVPPEIPTASPNSADDPRSNLLAGTDSTGGCSLAYNTALRCLSCSHNSVLLYADMLERGRFPDNFTFPSLLKIAANSRALRAGEALHAHVVKLGFAVDVYVRNNLMGLYAACGEILSANKVFYSFPERDLISWTTLISAYRKAGLAREAIQVFAEMVGENLRVDGVAIVAALSACAELGDLGLGRNLHGYIDAHAVGVDVFVCNALLDMYAKCGDVDSARKAFEIMSVRNIVSWNSMISGLVDNGEFKEALKLFRRMQGEGLEPDCFTLVGALSSCASLGALELGRWLHAYMYRKGIDADRIVGNALVDMYAKCGRIDQAREVFDAVSHKDVYSYTSMIVGFAMHGQGEEAMEVFADMLRAGLKPNEVTFVGVLSACSHAGLVEEGLRHFESMVKSYGITARIEHYGCVVDMLGRAGLLGRAQEFILSMPFEPDAFIWGSLLGACKNYSEVALGEIAMKRLLDIEPEEEGAYVLMSNLYTSSNCRRDGVRLRKTMRLNKVRKTPGCSLIEIEGSIHEFRKGDKSHLHAKQIYAMIDECADRLKMVSRDQTCYHHSERLAIAFGLISTKPDTSLRITKNLRVCDDCHGVIKAISKMYRREIIIRDRYRFHRFKNGLCSCNDYW